MANNPKRLRVLMIPSNYPTEENPTASVFFREQTRAVSLYCDVTVLFAYSMSPSFMRNGKTIKLQHDVEHRLDTMRVKFRKISNKVDIILSFLLSCVLLYRLSRTNKFDVIHAQKLFPAGVLALIASRVGNIPFVVTEHAGDVSRTMRTVLRKKIIQYTMRKTNHMIVVSVFQLNQIKKYKNLKQITVVPNAVDVFRFSLPEVKQEKRKIKKILHVSSLNHNKGLDYFVKAIKKLSQNRKDFFVDIVGGDHVVIKKYIAQIQNLGLTKIIKFHGNKNHDEIAEFMRKCDFFVLPSIRESFGVVLIEAMACGKSIIATKCGGPEEIITDQIGLLVPPADTEALAKSLEFMLNNQSKFNSDVIRQYTKNNFSQRTIGRKICKVYMKVIKKSNE